MSRLVWDQLPLLRHGGYGAASRTTLRYCGRCPYTAKPDRSEVNPLPTRDRGVTPKRDNAGR